MQRNASNIQYENHIAELILNEIKTNMTVKAALSHIAGRVILNIIEPISKAISQDNVKTIADLSKPYHDTVKTLAVQNIEAERPFGAVLSGFSRPEEITCSMTNIHTLLNSIRTSLSSVYAINSIEEALKFYKSIADLCFCYFEYLHELHRSQFDQIKNMIWLTPEEMDARVFRFERGEEKRLAITHGLSAQNNIDLVPESRKVGMNSAKSIFAGVSMTWRLEIIIKQFDEAFSAWSNANEEGSTIGNKASVEQIQFKKIEASYFLALKKMQFYKIPLRSIDREPLSIYAKRYETTFEKLAKLPNQTVVPLIANVSRSTARSLISLQDLGAFNTNEGSFNVELAQIFANGCAGFYIWGGNHSFTEAAEIYNRLLDYVAIEHPEQLTDGIIPKHPSEVAYNTAKDAVERKLPYYKIGHYQSFLHYSYAEKAATSSAEDTINMYYKNHYM